MTELLQQAIAEIAKLSDDQQDAIASRLLAELEDEQAWQASLQATTDTQWDNLADLMRQEIKSDLNLLSHPIANRSPQRQPSF